MSKYIKLEDAIDGACPFMENWENCINCPLDNGGSEPCKMGKWLKSLPTIDIVRCKDCMYAIDLKSECGAYRCDSVYCIGFKHDNDFCSGGFQYEEGTDSEKARTRDEADNLQITK